MRLCRERACGEERPAGGDGPRRIRPDNRVARSGDSFRGGGSCFPLSNGVHRCAPCWGCVSVITPSRRFSARRSGIRHRSGTASVRRWSLLARPRIFRGLPDRIAVGRYHSWIVDGDGIPDCLEVTARDGEGTVMALSHRVYDVHGVQFHPESVMTPCGGAILANFLKDCV